jgi:hypothetical protein
MFRSATQEKPVSPNKIHQRLNVRGLRAPRLVGRLVFEISRSVFKVSRSMSCSVVEANQKFFRSEQGCLPLGPGQQPK